MKLPAIILSVVVVFGLLVTFGHGQSVISWGGASNGSFNSASNWGGGALPTNSASIVATGTFEVTVDANATLTGTLTLGVAVLSNPTLRVVSGATLNVGNLACFNGEIIVESGASLIVNTALVVTAALGTTYTITGDVDNRGTVTVTTGTLELSGTSSIEGTYTVSSGATLRLDGTHTLEGSGQIGGAGTVVVASPASVTVTSSGNSFTIGTTLNHNSGATITVTNGGELVVSGAGTCNGNVDLGSASNGGTLRITGDYVLSCVPAGAGGSLVFDSSAAKEYTLSTANYTLATIEARGKSTLATVVSTANDVVISGKLVVSGSAKFVAKATVQVSAEVEVTATGALEIVSGGVTAAKATFDNTASYIVHVADETIAKLEVSGNAKFGGNILLMLGNNFQFASDTQVVVATYASHDGVFASADAQSDSSSNNNNNNNTNDDSEAVSMEYRQKEAVAKQGDGSGSGANSIAVVGVTAIACVAGVLAAF